MLLGLRLAFLLATATLLQSQRQHRDIAYDQQDDGGGGGGSTATASGTEHLVRTVDLPEGAPRTLSFLVNTDTVAIDYDARTDAAAAVAPTCAKYALSAADCAELQRHLGSHVRHEAAAAHIMAMPPWHNASSLRRAPPYLDLLKRVLVNSIYGASGGDNRDGGGHLGVPADAHTMIGLPMLANLQFCLEDALLRQVPGHVLETGVWRGGASIFARGLLREYGVSDRTVYAADSFAGLPPPAAAYPVDKVDLSYTQAGLAVSLKEVRANFGKYGLLDGQVVFVKGFFEATMPALAARWGSGEGGGEGGAGGSVHDGKLAVLRMDGDMYGSTWVVLQHMYERVSAGGFVIIDDYCLRTCRMAVLDFRERFNITAPIWKADWCGVYWQKPLR